MAERPQAFFRVAHEVLVRDKRVLLKDVGARLGLRYKTLHARLVGRVDFRPEEINRLLQAIPEVRLVDALLAGTSFTALPDVDAVRDRADPALLRRAAGALDQSLSLLQMCLEQPRSMADDVERRQLEAMIARADAALARVRMLIDAGVQGSNGRPE